MIKKYEPHIWKFLFLILTLIIGAGAYWVKSIDAKVNDGIFVRTAYFEQVIRGIKADNKDSDERLRREICDRLRRIETNQDLILQKFSK